MILTCTKNIVIVVFFRTMLVVTEMGHNHKTLKNTGGINAEDTVSFKSILWRKITKQNAYRTEAKDTTVYTCTQRTHADRGVLSV